jgi:hypothetical protein
MIHSRSDTGKFDRREAENMAAYYLLLLRSTRQIQYKEYTAINQIYCSCSGKNTISDRSNLRSLYGKNNYLLSS